MDPQLKTYLEEFIKITYSRLQKGEQSHNNAYERTDLFQQMIEELADVANYAFLEYVKVKRLQEKAKSFS